MMEQNSAKNFTDFTEVEPQPKDNEGRWFSKNTILLESHPKLAEIISLIKTRIELKLTYNQLAERIKKEYGLDFHPSFFRRYYITNYLPNSKVFKYVLDNEERMMNLLEEFHEAKADLNTARARNKMDFMLESNSGKTLPDSWKHANPIITLRREALQLGSAVGFFPQLQNGPTIQVNNLQQNVGVNNAIMQVLDAVLPKRNNETSNDSSELV